MYIEIYKWTIYLRLEANLAKAIRCSFIVVVIWSYVELGYNHNNFYQLYLSILWFFLVSSYKFVIWHFLPISNKIYTNLRFSFLLSLYVNVRKKWIGKH